MMSRYSNVLRSVVFMATASFGHFSAFAQKLIDPPWLQPAWAEDSEPFRIAGNLFYVGTRELACYLITTPDGHILINTGLAASVPLIRRHVEKAGFKFSDIKILLANHAHYDHVGGMAKVKELTHAAMMINERDASLLADGGNSDYVFGGKGPTFAPVNADRLLHDGDTVALGGTHITMLSHPGHTKGASSFIFDVSDGDHTYRILIANMPGMLDDTRLSGMPGYADVGKDYGYTLGAMKKLKFDIWLTPHASQFGLHTKRKPGDPYRPAAFVDRAGYDGALDKLKAAYLERLRQR